MTRSTSLTVVSCALLVAWGSGVADDGTLGWAFLFAFVAWRAGLGARRRAEVAQLRELGIRRVRVGRDRIYVGGGR